MPNLVESLASPHIVPDATVSKKTVDVPATMPAVVIPTPAPTPTPTEVVATGITKSEVAKHHTAQSCWSLIDGSVYDLTLYIPKHPGGERAILSLCGTDGSSAFQNAHGDANKPARILEKYKMGDLAK